MKQVVERYLAAFVAMTLASTLHSKQTLVLESVVVKAIEEVSVPATEPGQLVEVFVKPGDLVEEHSRIAQLRDDELNLLLERTKLEAAIAAKKSESDVDLRYAQKSTDVARAEFERSLESNAKYAKTVSNTELDRLRLLVEQGELATKKAEQERELAVLSYQIRDNEHRSAKEQLERRRIKSPQQGMVVEISRQRGEWVQAGDTIARIIRLDRLRVEGFIPLQKAMDLTIGQNAIVSIPQMPGESKKFAGKVAFISPEVDPLNTQVRIWVEIQNPELALKPGMVASLIIEMP
jgi:multidrug efflux pump subunit AcrA (membrane-fusion protein)